MVQTRVSGEDTSRSEIGIWIWKMVIGYEVDAWI
jgi:hypothetical protein